MALQKQNYQLSIVDGLDTKTDAKNVMPTRFLELENLVFTRTGQLSKTFGYTPLSKNVLSALDITKSSGVTTFNNELVQFANDSLLTYSPAESSWVKQGALTQISTTTSIGISDGYRNSQPSYETNGQFSLYAQQSNPNPTNQNVVWRLVDEASGTILMNSGIQDAIAPTIQDGVRPTVVYLDARFHIFFRDVNNAFLKVLSINPVSRTCVASTVIGSGTGAFCCRVIGNNFFLAYSDFSGAVLLRSITADFSGSTVISINSDSGGILFVHVAVQDLNDVRVVWSRDVDGYGAKSTCYNYYLNVNYHNSVNLFVALLSSGYRIRSVFSVSTFSKNATIYANVDPGISNSIPTLILAQQNIATSGGLGAASVLMYNVAMVAEPKTVDGQIYLAVAKGRPYNSNIGTVFIINQAGRIVGRLLQDSAVLEVLYQTNIYNPTPDTGNRLILKNGKLSLILITLGAITAGVADPTSSVITDMDFDAELNYFDTTAGQNLLISGNVMRMYDGQNVVEHGFLETPNLRFEAYHSNFGPYTPLGTYRYKAVYAWRDAKGQLHRSRPSNIVVASSTGTSSDTNSLYLYASSTPFTEKNNAEIELYRSSDNQSTYHKVVWTTSLAGKLNNPAAIEPLAYQEVQSDSGIVTNEVLYTEGGVLDNDPAQDTSFISNYKSRVFGIVDDGRALIFSKVQQENIPVAFSDFLKIPLDASGGKATALGRLDDNLIIFKEREIYVLTGEGPNNAGEQDDYRRPYLVTTDAGCIDPASVVVTPEGLMFKSAKGIYLLARGLAVSYIGAGVEAYNAQTIRSATLLSDVNEVRFTTLEGRTLVYDYYHKRWTTFTNQQTVDAVNYQNQWHYLRADGTLMREDKNRFDSAGSYVQTKITSAWISLAGIQGFQRFYRMLVLGNYKQAHTLKVKIAYDFDEAYKHEATIDTETVLNPTSYGEGNYGNGNYGGSYPLYQFDIRPKIQKCQSFKISLMDIGDTGLGQAFTLSNLAIELGVESGLNRKSAARRFGAK